MDLRGLKETKWSSHEHCKHLNKSLNTFRQQRQLCDVELIVEGKKFSAHLAVLAGVSSYFQNLFTIDMKEKREGKVEMKKLDSSIMEDFLHFVYTGEAFLTKRKAVELLKIANYTNVFSLQNLCEDFLMETLSLENCFALQRLADIYDCVKLSTACSSFFKRNFKAIMELPEFLEMTEKELEFYLDSNDIIVEGEEEVYDGLIKWIKYKEEMRRSYFTKLLSYIRLGSLSKQFIFSIVSEEEMVYSNQECSKIALKAASSSAIFEPNQQPRRCLEKTIQSIVICGGCGEDEYFTNSSFCFAPSINKWCTLASLDTKRNSHAVVELDGFIYVIGGKTSAPSDRNAPALSDVLRYDFRNNSWSSIASMPYATALASAVTLNGFIYVLGGYTDGERRNVMQKYCPTTNSWRLVNCPEIPRKNACCVSDETNIFIIGGERSGNTEMEDEMLDSCEKYIPKSNRWQTIAPMSGKRTRAAVSIYQQKIFVIGGCEESNDATGLCEMYNIPLECWSRVASIQVPRRCASAVTVNGKIHLLCGEDAEGVCVRAVECYSADKGWFTVAQMPTGRSLTTATRLPFAKVFLESCADFH